MKELEFYPDQKTKIAYFDGVTSKTFGNLIQLVISMKEQEFNSDQKTKVASINELT